MIDGESMYDPTLAKFCDTQNFLSQIQSSGNAMRIVFKTDASESGRGFSLRYRTGEIYCCTLMWWRNE